MNVGMCTRIILLLFNFVSPLSNPWIFWHSGVSLKTQELYLIVFVTRYLDIFTTFISAYNLVMKIIFLATSALIVCVMRFHKVISQTYDREQDTFRIIFLVGPALGKIVVFLSLFWVWIRACAHIPKHPMVLLARGFYVSRRWWGWWRSAKGDSKPVPYS